MPVPILAIPAALTLVQRPILATRAILVRLLIPATRATPAIHARPLTLAIPVIRATLAPLTNKQRSTTKRAEAQFENPGSSIRVLSLPTKTWQSLRKALAQQALAAQ